MASELSKIGRAMFIQPLSERLVRRIAPWLPAASLSATDRALSMSCARGTQALTSPMRSASLPSMNSAVSR